MNWFNCARERATPIEINRLINLEEQFVVCRKLERIKLLWNRPVDGGLLGRMFGTVVGEAGAPVRNSSSSWRKTASYLQTKSATSLKILSNEYEFEIWSIMYNAWSSLSDNVCKHESQNAHVH